MTNTETNTFASYDDIAGYTEGFRQKYKRNPSLPFEEALKLLQTAWNADNAASLTADDYTELFEDAETDAETDATSLVPDVVKAAIKAGDKHPVALRAENLAADAAKDETFRAFIDALEEKRLDVERGPLDVNFHLRRIYGAKLKDFPLVGSKGGNNADLYQGKYHKADGTEATKEMSFYTAFAATLPSYISVNADLQEAKLAESDPRAANVVERYRGKTKWFIKARVRLLKSRLNSIKALCVRAFVIEQNLARINEDMGKKVKATMVSHKNEATGLEEPAPGIKDVFMVGDWSNGETSLFAAHETLNISKFVSLDIDAAIKNGGTYDALMDTIKREPKTKTPTGMAVGTFDQLQSAWALSLQFFLTLKTPEQRTMLKSKLVTDKAGFLATVYSLKEELTALCSDPDLQKVHSRYQASVIEKEVAAAEQKTGTEG